MRRWLIAAVMVVATVGAFVIMRTGHDAASGGRVVSNQMARSFLPGLGTSPVGAAADLRALEHPDDDVRDWFVGQNAVYRVVDATRDEATLAVWQRAPTGPEPFNGNRTGEGTGCVTVRREGGTVQSRVMACTSPLGPRPSSDPEYWGRDAEARAAADEAGNATVAEAVIWLMTRESDGYPRSTPRTAEQVLTAVRSVALPAGARLDVAPSPDTGDGHVRARLTATATAPDPVDTRRTTTARGCFVLDVALDDLHPYGPVTTTACT